VTATRLRRSELSTPGTSPKMMAKAAASSADLVFLDHEPLGSSGEFRDGLWAQYPAVADWWARMRARPSVKATIFDRMKDNDWAPFRNLAPDPWPKVQELVRPTA